jgi:DNA segregation ATPase FtsK/SpoIIIE-like protein
MSPAQGALGALLLALSCGALALGIAGAVYLDRDRGIATETAQKSAPLPAVLPVPTGPAERMEGAAAPAESPPAAAVAEKAPEPSAEALAAIAPAAGPPATPGENWWVQYATYGAKHAAYAAALRDRLSALGIAAVVTQTPGRGRRRYALVRSAAPDRAAAEETAQRAQRALHLRPLIRAAKIETAAALPPPAPLPPTSPLRPRPARLYQVQFATVASESQGLRLAARLKDWGIAATVKPAHGRHGHRLYAVRTAAAVERAEAERIVAAAHGLDLKPLVLRGAAAPGNADAAKDCPPNRDSPAYASCRPRPSG